MFVAATPGRAERLIEVLDDYELRGVNIDRGDDSFAASVLVTTGVLSRGFRLPAAQLQIFAETDLFEEERRAQDRARRSAAAAFLSDLRDLKVGDLVVHVDNGIGEFVGLKEMNVGPNETLEFLELRYAGDDKLFVPVSRLDLIQKYSGGARPSLDRLGGTTWEKAKSRVKKAMRDMAEELLKLYAARKAVTGHTFSPDTHWQEEFETAFPFDLTVDQTTAIEDIKRDMESPTPMDRLLCGDVGYGKTVSPPGVLTALALDLKPGDDIDTQRLAETLVDAGFTHQDPVDEHGEFCIRGGVVDIFPAGDDLPARIELVGDTIEAIRRYAPDTQRSVVTTERLKVVPLREVVGEDAPRVPFFDYLGIARRPVIVASEPDEIRERIEKQLTQISESYEQAAAAGRSRSGTSPKPLDGRPTAKAGAGTETWAPEPSAILISWPDIDRQLALRVRPGGAGIRRAG